MFMTSFAFGISYSFAFLSWDGFANFVKIRFALLVSYSCALLFAKLVTFLFGNSCALLFVVHGTFVFRCGCANLFLVGFAFVFNLGGTLLFVYGGTLFLYSWNTLAIIGGSAHWSRCVVTIVSWGSEGSTKDAR